MPTTLDRRVVRKATVTRDAGRRLVVTLYPGDVIGLRPERSRTEYTITLAAVYSVAVKGELARRKAIKAAQRRSKRSAATSTK